MLQTKSRHIRTMVLLLLILLLVALLMGCGKKGTEIRAGKGIKVGLDENEAIATYNGGEVKVHEFEHFLNFLSFFNYPENQEIQDRDNWDTYLDLLVSQKVILERAKAKNVQVDAEEWGQVYTFTKEQMLETLEKGQTYEQLLQGFHLTEQDVIDQVYERMLFNEYFFTLKSDTELKQFYDDNPQFFVYVSVRHILIDNKKRTDEEAKAFATELSNRIRAGEDFATLANEFTDDEFGNLDDSNNKLGGLYEDQPVGQFVEPFKEAAIQLPLQQVSDPVQTEYGYHVMRVEKREWVPFEEVKKQIAVSEGQAAYNTFILEELEALNIESKLPNSNKE